MTMRGALVLTAVALGLAACGPGPDGPSISDREAKIDRYFGRDDAPALRRQREARDGPLFPDGDGRTQTTGYVELGGGSDGVTGGGGVIFRRGNVTFGVSR
ncbi:hypothetical protein ROJ8625_00849 [Roseivivax jejudonensis]|uniref:Lipoprotein n=1 Tax=Roseivivax jejudonensis TaxID=1529041 RepID=A0A1X6YHP6_9RHOB|nr:hypothetical protein [Roseivivax jejudonensis]SLN21961.1 hypothetical protein ROJ8625_00849 [Roseivivax jejudonensis]